MQPFTIVFPIFVSVFIIRVLPRILLAPLALFTLMVLNRWIEPIIDELQLPAEFPRVRSDPSEQVRTGAWL